MWADQRSATGRNRAAVTAADGNSLIRTTYGQVFNP
jgi:hypothetical protein